MHQFVIKVNGPVTITILPSIHYRQALLLKLDMCGLLLQLTVNLKFYFYSSTFVAPFTLLDSAIDNEETTT